MLLELVIRDFALIENLSMEFNKGLNILTGETGAGKSIIIDSVNFVLGERSSKDIIRTGVEKTSVEAIFESVDNPELIEIMESNGIEDNEGILIFSREMNQSGRSICRVNGRIVTTSVLKSIGNYLIDIHGQHEHQSLLDEKNHIDILDMFGENELDILKKEVQKAYLDVACTRKALNENMGDDRERQHKLDLYNFQIGEIDDAALKIGEEEELTKQRLILNNVNKLYTVLSNSYFSLYDSEEGQPVFDRLGGVLSELQSISGLDEKLLGIYKSVEESYYILEEAISCIREYRDKIDFNPELVDEVENRLDTINKLKRKYGDSIEEILKYREQAYNEVQYILNSQDRIEKLKARLREEQKILEEKSKALSKLRIKAAKKLESDVVNELKFLGMERSAFLVNFDIPQKDGQVSYNEKGMDDVRFLISPNPGEPEKPLARIASGGELSRIMLAIKTVLAHSDSIPSLIFDEIDTGISGKAAQAVAEKLGQISCSHQVICVTHLPQIASMADTHFFISKSVVSGKTITSVEKLDDRKQVLEIARMLGGVSLTDLTVRHAEEMISMAQNLKNQYKKQ